MWTDQLSVALVLFVLGATGLETRYARYGVVTEPAGEVRTYTTVTNVVIVRTHPRVIRQGHLAGLLDRAGHLFQLVLSHGDTKLNLYAEHFAWIRRGTRRKCNILGDGLRWLTGAATLDDVQAVKDDVASVAEQLQ